MAIDKDSLEWLRAKLSADGIELIERNKIIPLEAKVQITRAVLVSTPSTFELNKHISDLMLKGMATSLVERGAIFRERTEDEQGLITISQTVKLIKP